MSCKDAIKDQKAQACIQVDELDGDPPFLFRWWDLGFAW